MRCVFSPVCVSWPQLQHVATYKNMNDSAEGVRIYIVEISCQFLDVLLQLIRCLQAILEKTGQDKNRSVTDRK